MAKITVAIHKLTSCSGCQLAFLNQGGGLLNLLDYIEIAHFIEGGIYNPDCEVDVAFVEGSISTPHDLERAKSLREKSKLVVTIGACATSGGVQALRNITQLNGGRDSMMAGVYAKADFIETLDNSEPVASVIKVDYELWGCPVSTDQMASFLSQLLLGAEPKIDKEKLCMQCKRQQTVCVLVTKQAPCLGPVTRTGCGAMCPSYGKACYNCYGPSEQPNIRGMANRLEGLGFVDSEIANRFALFHSNIPEFRKEILRWTDQAESMDKGEDK